MFKLEEAVSSSIIEVGKNKTKVKKYHFKCDNFITCQNLTTSTKAGLKDRKTRLCKKCSNLIKLQYSRDNFISSKLRPYEALYNNLLKGAKRKNLKCTLTFEEFLEFTKINNCIYCDNKVEWTKYHLAENGFRYNLDRMNNNIGYDKNNLVVCCWFCNNLKSNLLSHEEFILLSPILKQIIKNRNNEF